jgi:hypothetical protein
MPSKKSTLTKADIERELIALDRITQALNTAVVALYYITKPDVKALDNVKAEDYVKYIQENVHPLVRRADEISKEVAEKASKEAKKAVKE